MLLTDEQQAIVAHTHGPALVFAVAGSGKTTAMIHRIRRLVDEAIVPPRAILATSFGTATVRDIKRQLAHCPQYGEVGVYTLHSMGFRAIRAAKILGYFDYQEGADTSPDEVQNILFFRAVKRARAERVSFAKELDNVNKDDFLDYVGACKGNLRYADLKKACLPAAALQIASQAQGTQTIPWYLPLYALYEEVRRETGLLTYDDMLMTGWELLIQHPRVLAAVSGEYQSVLVDEFQDVNLAQSEILDLISAAHRNYMVIGDDDQTIFEWRGASPKFILSFASRYGARKYTISDNFRCHASQVALANKVIERNTHREPKRVHLTKGFGGNTHVFKGRPDATVRYVTNEIQQELAGGRRLREIAILVRVYAQTPIIEQALTRAQIPYRIVGSQPFYKRPEVAALLNYLRLTPFERKLHDRAKLSPQELRGLRDAWLSVYNTPSRYLSREAAESILKEAAHRGASLSATISLNNPGRGATGVARIDRLAELLDWLAAADPNLAAGDLLSALVERLEYRKHLLASSGFIEVGEGKVANVEAFLSYAKSKGSAPELLDHITEIGRQHQETVDDQQDEDYVRVMTIHRSKGLQWPVVFLPDCNTGTLPPTDSCNIEEERRLVYVAITRTMEVLHLLVNEEAPVSSFLLEADYQRTLEKVNRVAKAVLGEANRLSSEEVYHVKQHIGELFFDRYLQQWWEAAQGLKQQFLELLRTNNFTPPSPPAPAVHLSTASAAEQRGMRPPGGDAPQRSGRPVVRVVQRTRPGAAGAQGQQASSRSGSLYVPGDRVRHPVFGEGEITASSQSGGQEIVRVTFLRCGEKTLNTSIARLERTSNSRR
jgi:DNA helicase-2/ATP-dependent DNA helicase PcrA